MWFLEVSNLGHVYVKQVIFNHMLSFQNINMSFKLSSHFLVCTVGEKNALQDLDSSNVCITLWMYLMLLNCIIQNGQLYVMCILSQ